MKRHLFLTLVLFFIWSPSAKSQKALSYDDLVALSQKSVANAVNILYREIKDFDRECFLLGTMDDYYMGHDRIATYEILMNGMGDIDLALIVLSLFRKDYPDLRALRVCNRCCPAQKYYGSEVKSYYDREDSICKKNPDVPLLPPYEIELFSPSLAKVIAGYYHFGCEKPSISSGDSIGYKGVINKEKISTQAQKRSFLTGVSIRYGGVDDKEIIRLINRVYMELQNNMLAF